MADTDQKTGSEQRTDFAEDRTILANERTLAAWLRSGYAAIGIGLAFQALFNKVEPSWLPRLIATGFLATAILMMITAERRACRVFARLSQHHISSVDNRNLRVLVAVSVLAASAMIVVIWRAKLENYF